MRCGLGTKWFNGILSMIRKQGMQSHRIGMSIFDAPDFFEKSFD